MALRHRELSDLVLYELYEMAAEPSGISDIPPHDLYLSFDSLTSDRFYDAAIETLGNKGYIEKAGVLPDSMAITTKGISYIDEQLDDFNSFLSRELQFNDGKTRVTVPASNRFVELDHNSAAYQEAVAAGDELIQAVRESNAYTDTDSADKEHRLAELEAGYRLLRAPRVNAATAKAILTGVLTYLITKFADQPIGDLAKVAWSALKTLFGFH